MQYHHKKSSQKRAFRENAFQASLKTTDFISERRRRLLTMDLSAHFIITGLLAAALYYLTGRGAYAVAAVLGGIFIDLDHLVDYFLFFGFQFRPKDFFYGSYLSSGRVYVIFHSWELIFIIFCLGFFTGSGIILALFLGMAIHLTIDTLQRQDPRMYFLVHRVRENFDAARLVPETLAHVAAHVKNRRP